MRQGITIPRKMSGGMSFLGARGFTLIELMITLVVVAIGVALAVPAWDNLVQKRNMTNSSEEIATLISWAQGEAIKRNEQVTVTVRRFNDTQWCVGAIDQTRRDAMGLVGCDCFAALTANDACLVDGTSARIHYLFGQESSMTGSQEAGTEDGSFWFSYDPIRGLKVTNAGAVDPRLHTIQIQSKNTNYELQVDVSVTGRTRICNSNSAKKVPGYDTCVSAPITVPPPPT